MVIYIFLERTLLLFITILPPSLLTSSEFWYTILNFHYSIHMVRCTFQEIFIVQRPVGSWEPLHQSRSVFSPSNVNINIPTTSYLSMLLLILIRKLPSFCCFSAMSSIQKFNLQIFTCSIWFLSHYRSYSICWSCIKCA